MVITVFHSDIDIHSSFLSVDLGFICILSGSRGVLREIWTSTVKHTLSDIASLDSAADDYHMEYWPESSSPEVDTFIKTSGYSSKISFFFVPSWQDYYRFYIQSDDTSELHLSHTGNPADKVHGSQLAQVLFVVNRIIDFLTLDPNFWRPRDCYPSFLSFTSKWRFFHGEFSLKKPHE